MGPISSALFTKDLAHTQAPSQSRHRANRVNIRAGELSGLAQPKKKQRHVPEVVDRTTNSRHVEPEARFLETPSAKPGS